MKPIEQCIKIDPHGRIVDPKKQKSETQSDSRKDLPSARNITWLDITVTGSEDNPSFIFRSGPSEEETNKDSIENPFLRTVLTMLGCNPDKKGAASEKPPAAAAELPPSEAGSATSVMYKGVDPYADPFPSDDEEEGDRGSPESVLDL